VKSWLTASFACLVLCACGSNEVLVSKPAAVPTGLDLSGDWVMSASTGFSQRESRELAVRVFLEMGTALKVTQTGSGLFFSFDRSVVEEYRFGENREVEVGAITAERVSGWEGRSYVIETLDKDGAKLIESWQLREQGSVLLRSMVIWNRSKKELALEQTFNRI
jgi:hypothetical protein